MGTAQRGPVGARFRLGIKDYAIGNHPLWELFRSLYQMSRKPMVVGGLALGAGYFWAWVRRRERPVTPEFVRFHRGEQMDRLRRFFRRSAKRDSPPSAREAEPIQHSESA